ncbi:MAG: hypothetical protein IPJ94_28075 [Chloroflexi bacterium]|nr:hypothetical protein [Chloroflexota bacterium]
MRAKIGQYHDNVGVLLVDGLEAGQEGGGDGGNGGVGPGAGGGQLGNFRAEYVLDAGIGENGRFVCGDGFAP